MHMIMKRVHGWAIYKHGMNLQVRQRWRI